MRKRLVAILCALSAAGTFAAEAPLTRVPFDAGTIKVDGVIDDAEWRTAAIVRSIIPLGGASRPSQRTEFMIKHDGERICVAARCFETERGCPESHPRDWDDSFFGNDDCVELVLGVADHELRDRGRIDVGGYEGALDGAVTAADEYFTFVVNASGSRQRQFNEMPIPDRGFKSACSRGKGEWSVEMVIPRTAVRMPTLTGTTAFANFFRFRPPVMMGWHLPAFGGYAAMPFGRIEFLQAGAAGTVESPVELAEDSARASGAMSGELGELSIQYGPLNHVVVGVIRAKGRPEGLEAVLEVSGLPVRRERLVFSSGQDRDGREIPDTKSIVVCELPPGDQPERSATLTVLRDGVRLAETSRTCEAAEMPDWLGTREAVEYEEDVVPRPWAKPVIAGSSVRLVDKSVTFADLALPLSVRRTGMLSATFRAAPHLRIVRDGRSSVVKFSGLTLSPMKNRVRLDASAVAKGVRFRAFGILDYDGFLDYTLAVDGEQASGIERMELVLPLFDCASRHFLPGTGVQNGGALSSAGWRGAGCPFWIGNEQEGLFFNYDESPFRGEDRRHAVAVSAVRGGKDVVLSLVDSAGQIGKDGDVFRFFLQPTPTKPYPREPVRHKTNWWWEGWSSYHGYPDLSKTNAVREMVAKESAEGRALTLYCCQGLQENAPEMERWREDLSLCPDWCYYRWQGHRCFATCKRGPEGDFQIARYARIIRETGISGLMSDGLSVAWGCDNVLHPHGCGRTERPAVGTETLSRTVAQRRFLKRIRGLFDRTGRPFCLVAHTGGGIDANTLSFFDAYFEGEQLTRFRRGYYPPRSLYSIGYTGLPWGWRTIYWPKQLHNYNGLDSALVYALLHDSEYYANPDVEPPFADTDILVPFSTPDSVFHPYWKGAGRIRFAGGENLLSVYEKPGEALLVVGNLRPHDCAYSLDLSSVWPGEPWQAEDVLRKCAISGREVRENLRPFSCRVIRIVRGAGTVSAAPPPDSDPGTTSVRITPETSKWTFENVREGMVSDDGVVSLGADPSLGAAIARYSETFGRDLVLEGEADLSERFAFELGDQCLTYGGGFPGWGWMLRGKANPYGRGWIYGSVGLRTGTMVPFRLVLSRGILDVWYDGQRVVRRLALDLPESGNAFSLRTWHTDSLRVRIGSK